MENTGYLFPEIYKNPKKYLYDYSAKELVKHLKSKDISVFLATNSFYEFADFVLKNTFGYDYLDYVDLCVFYSKKPSFFQKDIDRKGYFVDVNSHHHKGDELHHTEITSGEKIENLKDKKILLEGNYKIVEEYFRKLRNKEDLKLIFVGDNINSDCLHPPKLDNWKTIAVNEHIECGQMGVNPPNFMKGWLDCNPRKCYFRKILRENTIFTISNVESLKHL